MDWDIPVRVWLIEMLATDVKKDQLVRALLRAHGYRQPKNRWDHEHRKRVCEGLRGKGQNSLPACTPEDLDRGANYKDCCVAWFGNEVWEHPDLVTWD